MPQAAKLNVVVVDDQSSIRGLVRAGLNGIGVSEVREYGSAADALGSLKAQPSNIVISDFNMPEMDGLEFLRALRADDKFKNTAFILLTGRADKDLVKRAVQFGANNYLVKPFTVAVLKQKIEQVVGALT
jgi:two-component system chemotaxis response regulator CheY